MGIRSRTLAVAATGGLYRSWRSLQTFELDVMARQQRDAVAVIAAARLRSGLAAKALDRVPEPDVS